MQKISIRPLSVTSLFILYITLFMFPGQCENFKPVPYKTGIFLAKPNYPSNFVQSLASLRDSLWIGTDAGLARFDGLTWKTFRGDHLVPDGKYRYARIRGNVPELGAGGVNDILPMDSYIWFATDSGLVRYQTVTDRWYVYNSRNSPLKTDYIQCVTPFTDKIVIGTWGFGITIHDPQSNLFSSQVGTGFQGKYILAVAADKFRICVGTLHNGLNIYSPRENVWENITAASGKIPSNRINALERDNKSFFIGTDKGLVIFNLENRSTSLITTVNSNLIGNNIKALHHDPQSGLLYVGTTDGLSIFDGTYWKSVNENQGLPQNWVSSVTTTGDEIWVGTHDAGIARLKKQ
ncbi:MAG: hypothetical protein CVV64_01300 [Candidatus Wallbacteria bacterium HGW-Wallbacteria-1]|jgi:ligand-binding sensor domain-containing protein|uniref:Uncharacterized protein n=1 Tax=Candidatus Wallbacteria bacterium HGW-Wallbacteria-1 TaxID=2013854 RepID=A0A2N1PUV7_9BACT|nr:MAG: hypothetical protein CVV64_01300 [Candidatus Wallbacteria bacterium HGW-Wallbacteria-1]